MWNFSRTILGAAMLVVTLLAISAPSTAQPQAMTTRLPVPGCRIGEEFSMKGVSGLFRYDILTVNKGAASAERLDAGTPAGEYVLPLYRDVKDGRAPRFTGPDAEAMLSILGINAGGVPSEIPYLSGMGPRGNGICRGYAKVVQVARNEIYVIAPVRAGQHLGQLSFLMPTAVLKGFPATLACVTWNINIHVPSLDRGPRKGWKRTSCDLPGNWPGHTRVGEANANEQKWIMFGGVVVTNNQAPTATVYPPLK
jgi:hypothetical protein